MIISLTILHHFIGSVRLHHQHIQVTSWSGGREVRILIRLGSDVEVFVDVGDIIVFVGGAIAIVLFDGTLLNRHQLARNFLLVILLFFSVIVTLFIPIPISLVFLCRHVALFVVFLFRNMMNSLLKECLRLLLTALFNGSVNRLLLQEIVYQSFFSSQLVLIIL
jgi:hypothetical protein